MITIDTTDTQEPPAVAAPVADAKRRALNKTEKLAAVICSMTVADPIEGTLIPLINPAWAKTVTAKEIVAVFERWHDWDHRVPLGMTGTNHPTNIDPLPRHTHETVKTPADLAAIAKAKRLAAEQAAFRQRLLARHQGEEPPPKPKRKSRPMPGTKASGYRHRIDGTWERRERSQTSKGTSSWKQL